PTWQLQLAELAHGLRLWTGRQASLVEMSRSQATQGFADREPFLADADQDAWLIAGSPLGQLAGRPTRPGRARAGARRGPCSSGQSAGVPGSGTGRSRRPPA